MDIFELLIKDHIKVKKILQEMCETTSRAIKKRQELLEQLVAELKMHEKIEERIFYPPLKDNHNTRQLTLEAYEEHRAVDDLIDKLAKLEPSDERWLAVLTVIKENLHHHIKEEEDRLFLKAREEIDEQELSDMAQTAQAIKQEETRA
jgi:iron-sulfur cluster repair protein YtfE (RIC family)